MYSTWKTAFERAWAGPSWISWASRERSASWASTIRISRSIGGRPSGSPAMRLTSPRSRKSQDALQAPMGELEPGQLGLVGADLGLEALDLGPQRPVAGRRRRRPRRPPRGGRPAAGDLADPLPTRSALERVELVADLLVARRAPRGRRPDSGPRWRRSCSPNSRAPPSPRRGARRIDRRVPRSSASHPSRSSIEAGHHGQTRSRRRGSIAIARASSGSAGAGPRSSSSEAGGARGSRWPGPPATDRGSSPLMTR